MPEKVEKCVADLLSDPDFHPRKKDQSKRSAAFAVCTAVSKKESIEGYEVEVREGKYTARLLTTKGIDVLFSNKAFEAHSPNGTTSTSNTFKGVEWRVQLIQSGEGLNRHDYPLEVLHKNKGIFEGVPVLSAFGPDHSDAERGVKSTVGFVKEVITTSEGLDGIVRISDPSLRATLLDFYNEGVLAKMVGLSIRAEGFFTRDKITGIETAQELTKAASVDLVREPAAGGKFKDVLESTDVDSREDSMVTIEAEKLQEMLDKAASSALEKQEEARAKAEEAKDKEKAELKAKAEEEVDKKEEEDKAKKDAKNEGTLKAEESVKRFEEAAAKMDSLFLNQAVSEAKLPPAAATRVLETFSGKSFDSEKVQGVIKAEKDYLASYHKTIVENLSEKRQIIVQVDEGDKLLTRIDAMFSEDGYITLNDERIPAFKSWTEAYCVYNGINPLDVDKEEIWHEWTRGSTGYDSSNRRQVKKIYEALLQQSSWGEVTADRMHKALINNYEDFKQYDDWRKIARKIPVNDYQTYRDIKLGGYANLAVVVEGGTYPEATHFTDEETTVQLRKRGVIVPQITRELILNDNVRAIQKIPRELARAAKRTLYEGVFDVMRSNDTYGPDSTSLFHANHSNTGTTALSISGIDVANLAMRSQTKYGSTSDVLGAQNKAKILVVPNELEGLAERITNPSALNVMRMTADTDAMDDLTRFKGLEVIVCDYFTDATEYYLIADPSSVMGIGVAFLNGNEEPELFIQANENVGEMFSMDVQNVKIRHEWREVITDYRPFYRHT